MLLHPAVNFTSRDWDYCSFSDLDLKEKRALDSSARHNTETHRVRMGLCMLPSLLFAKPFVFRFETMLKGHHFCCHQCVWALMRNSMAALVCFCCTPCLHTDICQTHLFYRHFLSPFSHYYKMRIIQIYISIVWFL